MGAKIHHAAYSLATKRKTQKSSILLSIDAVQQCLNSPGINPPDLGVFINTGIYRDKHMGEPAIAALIHGDLNGNNGTPFCYDLINGGVGFLDAIQVCNNMLNQEEVRAACVVTGDAIPRWQDRWNFPYLPAASAITLLPGSENTGFVRFFQKSFPEHSGELNSVLSFEKSELRKSNRHILKIKQSEEYLSLALQVTQDTIEEFLAKEKIPITDFDLIISSMSPVGYAPALFKNNNIEDKMVDLSKLRGEVHTASLGIGLTESIKNASFERAKNILFIGLGAGIQVSLAWYKNE